jgi:anti-sigma-K factor RskA
MEPPPELKTRLMAAVHADLAAERAADPVPRQAPSAGRGWLSRLLGSPRGGFALAGAVAAIVAVLVVTNPFSGDGGDEALVQSFDFNGISGELSYVPGEGTASMTVEGLEPAPEGHVYQVWAITDGSPDSIGFLDVAEDGTGSSELDAEPAGGQTVAVTVEPDGGSPLPTTDPVFGVDI